MKAHAENFKQCEEDSPWKYKLSDWLAGLKRTWKEASHDNVSVIAAGVAFFSLLAVFPLITAALSTVSYFVDPEDVQGITNNFAELLPSEAFGILNNQINSVLSAPPRTASFGIVFSLGFALFSAGAGIRAMMRAMNVAYEEIETRNPLVFFFFGFLMTLGSLIFVWGSLCIIIGVSTALSYTNFEGTASFTTRILGFSKFVTHFGSYNETFGGLASVIILLIWLWLTAMVVICGAELNAELERQTIADSTRGPCRPVGERGAVMADFVTREMSAKLTQTKANDV